MMPVRKRAGKTPVAFSFVLDHLYPHEPVVKPMFGCHAVYLGEKIVLILRRKKNHPEVNGVWLATQREHHASLRKEFPSMGSVTILGQGTTNWQMIHEDDPDFEAAVLRVCELVVKGDRRIGHVPKRRSAKRRPGP